MQGLRDMEDRAPRARRVALEDRGHDLRGTVASERTATRQHLVEHDAEGKYIGACVHGPAENLLRSHVGPRPHHDPWYREVRLGGRRHAPTAVAEATAALASPKSSSFAPARVSMTLPGFRSRWMMPARCAASSAAAI